MFIQKMRFHFPIKKGQGNNINKDTAFLSFIPTAATTCPFCEKEVSSVIHTSTTDQGHRFLHFSLLPD